MGYEYRSKVVAVAVAVVVVVVVVLIVVLIVGGGGGGGGVVSGIIVITSEALRYRFRFLSHRSTRATCRLYIFSDNAHERHFGHIFVAFCGVASFVIM